MAGDIANPNIKILSSDNFHPAPQLLPYHHPEITSTCKSDTTTSCTVSTVSCTELSYESTNDDGVQSVGSFEMKTKLKSRDAIQKAAGNPKYDFHQMDEVGNRC